MYHVEKINIKPKHPLFEFCETATQMAKNMYNVANFYIRNTMTGLAKEAGKRTSNESEVLQIVQDGIHAHNEKALKKQAGGKKAVLFDPPTQEQWFLNYYVLDAVFKESDNVDYRSHHAHLIQAAIRECVQAWNSYFELIKKANMLNGKPKIPNYIHSDHKTATLSNIACRIQNGLLRFPNCREKLDVSKLPHFADKLIEVRVVPYCGIYQIQIVTDDGIKAEKVSVCTSVKDIPSEAGVAMLDPGIRNFATIVDNKGNTPIIVKGEALISRNQWYNRQMSALRSIQMKGHNPKTYHPKTTKRMNALSRKRDAFLTDTFYKMAHFIFRKLSERNISYLIIGKNSDWKQNVDMGHKNNQEFVSIPHAMFFSILQSVSSQYSIQLFEQEESYTSKASFLDKDTMPETLKNSDEVVFSGRRIRRGLYRSGQGILINADVNGAANIGRKATERIFDNILDFSYLTKSVSVCKFTDLNRSAKRRKRAVAKAKIQSHKVFPVTGSSGCVSTPCLLTQHEARDFSHE